MRKLIICFLVSVICLLTHDAIRTTHYACAETVKLKMIVANPSETEVKTIPVKFYLPKEIKPEDIIDREKFEIGYDFEKSLYYIHQEVTLEPKETITLGIGMNDVWIIPAEDLEQLRGHAEKILAGLKNSEYYNQAKILAASISERLEAVLKKQNQGGLTVEQRISHHSANAAVIKEVKKDIAVLEDLAVEVSGLSGLPVSELMGESVSAGEPAFIENAAPDIENAGTVKFKIELSNNLTEKKVVPLKYYLPLEVRPEYIVNKDDLDVSYDYQKGVYYAHKDAVNLAPNEKKEFVIEVKDVWRIPEQRIEILRAHTAKLTGMLAGPEYKGFAKSLNDRIIAGLNKIKNTQDNPPESVEKHIGNYRANLVKLDEIKKDVVKLEKLVMQAGGFVAGVTLAEIKPQADARTNDGLARGAKGMELVGKSIFRGKAPDATTSWNIIWIIVGFLAVVSFLFFILWWMQIKAGAGKKREEVNQKEKK